MTNTDFETQVLKKLGNIEWKIDKIDDRIDEVKSDLSQEIKLQGAYLNQAFDRMSYMQQTKAELTAK